MAEEESNKNKEDENRDYDAFSSKVKNTSENDPRYDARDLRTLDNSEEKSESESKSQEDSK
ncbi:hypothetical protein OB905_11730 [Halobacteria archaeon AArc-dxtr1]|nr:hypothetical protein [Halobacteria archaeon AArc-dxtr1]